MSMDGNWCAKVFKYGDPSNCEEEWRFRAHTFWSKAEACAYAMGLFRDRLRREGKHIATVWLDFD